MELELNLDENKNEILEEGWFNNEFKGKLDMALNKNILSFNSVEDSKYTSENLNTIYNEYRNLEEKVKYDYADKCPVAGCEEGKLYSIKNIDKTNGTVKLNEYNGVTMSRQTICVSLEDIPENIKSNMFLRKKIINMLQTK